MSSDSCSQPWPTKLCMHGWSACSGAKNALIAPSGTIGSQILSYFKPMIPRTQNRLFHLPLEENTSPQRATDERGFYHGLILYNKQVSWRKVSPLSYLFTSLTADVFRLLWLVPPSTAEQTSCTQPFAGIVCCVAFQMLGNQQLLQPINRTGLKMKSPASTPGLLTP